MEDRINKALAQLEKDLQEINSARNQVESTVKASTDLQKVVSEYVSSVQALSVGLQALESELRAREGALSNEYEDAISRVNSTCTEIISSFGTVVEKASTDFKGKTDSTIEKFTQQNTILTERVKDMNALKDEIKKTMSEIQTVKESLTQISKDVKESQEGQDRVLDDLKQKADAIPDKIQTASDAVIDNCNRKHQDIKSVLDELSQSLSGIDAKIDRLAETTSAIQLKCDAIKSSVDEANASIASSKLATTKAINVNRWILIVGIIVLAALHFI